MASTTLAEDYLAQFTEPVWGDPSNLTTPAYIYRYYLGIRQRIGQAFFNALPPTQQDQLVGTDYDPFYTNDSESVYKAIEYLMSLE